MSKLTPERESSLRDYWAGKSLTELTNFIVAHYHARSKEAIQEISEHIEAVCNAAPSEAKDVTISLKHLRGMLIEDLAKHSKNEEEVLFPYIRALEAGATSGRTLRSTEHIQDMHDQIVDTLVRVKLESTLCRLPKSSCDQCRPLYDVMAVLLADLQEHTFLEEEILFPRALHLEKRESTRMMITRRPKMNMIDPEKRVCDLALIDPRIRAALEKLGIDTCCGGKLPLADAVAHAGLSLDTVWDTLNAAMKENPAVQPDSRDWSIASLAELADHIESVHHTYLWTNLPILSERFEKVVRAHGAKHGELLQDLQKTFAGLRGELEPHLRKEEQVLFPYLRQMSQALAKDESMPQMHCGSVGNPIRQMEAEHENAGAALQHLRERSGNYTLPEDACPTFAALYKGLQEMEADLHEHIFLENNILFPLAEEAERTAKHA